MVQSADSVDTNPKRLIPSNERLHETNRRLLVVGMGCRIIVILLEMAPTISSMGSGSSTSLFDRQFIPIFCSLDQSKTEEDRIKMKTKLEIVKKILYIEPGIVLSLTHMFYVRKG